MKKYLISLLAMILAVMFAMSAVAEVLSVSGQRTAAQFRDWNSKEKYQWVYFGHYPYSSEDDIQPVLWRVLDAYDDGRALLLTEYVVDAHEVIEESDPKVKKNHTYRRISTIEESDLYPWMNTVMADQMFTKEEQAVLDHSRGIVFLLTDKELLRRDYGFSATRYGEVKQRQTTQTEYALQRGSYREAGLANYWVNNIKHPKDWKLQLCGLNGHLSYGGYTRGNVGIRPAILIKPGTVTFVSGSGTKADPYVVELLDAE